MKRQKEKRIKRNYNNCFEAAADMEDPQTRWYHVGVAIAGVAILILSPIVMIIVALDLIGVY